MTTLLCQTEMRLTRVTTRVVSCTPAEGGFAVVPAATVLYPEGGGQPDDAGTLNGQPVLALRLLADGGLAHLVARPVGDEVTIVLDWDRRFDAMQQHTGQHLISAVALERLNLATTGFHLGPERSHVEFDAHDLPPRMPGLIEAAVNEVIRQARPVRVHTVTPEQAARMPVRSRRLPDGLAGPLRLVEIDGLDLNTCGGTHVANTAELQAVKLLGTERLGRGTRVFYLAGGRVLSALAAAGEKEREITRLTSAGPAEHLQALVRLQADLKEAQRSRRALSGELAEAIGLSLASRGPVATLHRDDADMEFARAIAGAARKANPDIVLLVTGGTDGGIFLLAGPEQRVADLGPRVAALLEGRGGGGKGSYQGKAGNLSARDRAAALVLQAGSGTPTPHS